MKPDNKITLLVNAKAKKSIAPNFSLTDDAVYYEPLDGDPLPICSRLEIKALVRDSSSENWGRLLVFHDTDNQEHTWAMPMQMLKNCVANYYAWV